MTFVSESSTEEVSSRCFSCDEPEDIFATLRAETEIYSLMAQKLYILFLQDQILAGLSCDKTLVPWQLTK